MAEVFLILSSFLGLASSAILNYGQSMNQCDEQLCLMLMNNLTLTGQTMKWDDKKTFQTMHYQCNAVQNCFGSLDCRRNDWNFQTLANQIKVYCDNMNFLLGDFEDCDNKLQKPMSKAKCVTTGSCSELFGSNNCMKKVILDKCGQQKWIDFKYNQLQWIAVISPRCNLEQYWDL